MPRLFRLLPFLISFFIGVLAGPALGTDEPEPASPLKIAYCRYMPFYFEGANQAPRGILVDLWEQWSEKTGIPVEFSLLSWEDVLEGSAQGSLDINPFMIKSRERARRFDFSDPIMDLSVYLYYRNRTAEVKGLDHLAAATGIRVGVVAKDYTHTYLDDRLPGITPEEFPDHEALIEAAMAGRVDAFLMEGPVASTYLAKHGGPGEIRRGETPLYTRSFHAGVKKGNTTLLELVNRGLAGMSRGEIQGIVLEWTGAREPAVFRPYTGTVRIAASIDNMPFHFADDQGRAVGMFVDLWQLWSEKTGIPVAFLTAPWAESLNMVKEGRADLHAGCFFSVHRDSFLDYANILRNCETHFFFHESIFGLKNLEDLRGFRIGVLDQDYAVEFVNRELPEAALKLYDSHQALFDGVTKGEIRVFICDTPTALYFLKQKKLLPSFRYHPAHPLYQKPFYAAVSEGNTLLKEQINRGLAAITREERAAIERKWMGMSRTRKADTLVVAVAREFPPFSMASAQGRPSGLLIDIWAHWARETGKSVTFRLYDREGGVNALKDGIVDILAYHPPEARVAGWTQYSAPFYRLDWFLYHLDRPGSGAAWDDRDGLPFSKIIGVVRDTRAHGWLSATHPKAEARLFDSTHQMILGAANQEVDAFLALSQEMAVLPGRLGVPGPFIPGSRPLFRQPVGAGIRNYNPALIQLIEDGFDAVSPKDLARMESHWVREASARVFNPSHTVVSLSREEKNWLARHQDAGRKIRLGITPDWPPFEFLGKDGSHQGMAADYVALLNRRLGLNMTVEPGEAADLQSASASLEPGAPQFIRTRAYAAFPWVIVNKRQAPLISGLRDLHNRKLAVVRQYAVGPEIVKAHPAIQPVWVDSAAEGLIAVSNNRADAFVGNLAVVGHQLQARSRLDLKVAAEADLPDSGLVFGVRQDWPELAAILDKGIANISQHEHDAIRQKWFSIRFEHGVDPAYARGVLLKTGLAALVILGLVVFWSRQVQLRREAAEAANQRKTQFLASLSHEIRTPLNAILGMVELTLKTPLTPGQGRNLCAAKDSAQHLLAVISDLLDVSTIEAGKMQIQEQVFQLNSLLDFLEHTWTFQAAGKGLDFSLERTEEVPDFIASDPVRLGQILGNLISNAVKFTRHGRVRLNVETVPGIAQYLPKKNSLRLRFSVEDTGIGIEPDHLDQIFQRFTQAQDSITREYGGTGLGLAICRETARLMGGTLSVESTPGKGSCFSLELPVQVVTDPDPSVLPGNPYTGTPVPRDQGPGLSLLLVEDDPMNARVFKEFLAPTPHRVFYAGDGIEALDLLKTETVDLVFMDIEMPRLDGLSCCRAIRNGESGRENRNVPVIAMSAHVLPAFREKAEAAGMNDFIAKPVDMGHLFRVIARFRPVQAASATNLMDREKALASLGGNPDLLATVIRIFQQETPGQLDALKAALADKDVEAVRRWAHTLKGSAARIFAHPCQEAAGALEKAAGKEDPGAMDGCADMAIQAFETLMTALDQTP